MKFLDIIENGWASEDNPRRIGIFIRKSGRNFEMTDGKGDFWIMAGDNKKMKVIGNVLDKKIKIAEEALKQINDLHIRGSEDRIAEPYREIAKKALEQIQKED